MYIGFILVCGGISDCLFAEAEGERDFAGVEIFCVRDWKGERILKKCAKTNACVWSEAEAVALKSPVRKLFCGHTQRKTVV